MKSSPVLLVVVLHSSLCLPASGQVPSPLHGITIDNVKNLPEIVASIGNLSQKMTTRVVHNPGKKANEYRDADRDGQTTWVHLAMS